MSLYLDQYLAQGLKRPRPTGFSWLPTGLDVYAKLNGTFHIPVQWENLFRSTYTIASGTIWVDKNHASASDSNSGTSSALPKLTINSAIQAAGNSTIRVRGYGPDDPYDTFLHRRINSNGSVVRSIIGYDKPVYIACPGDKLRSLTWALSSGKTYTMEATLTVAPGVATGAPQYGPTLVSRVSNRRILHPYTGLPLSYQKMSSIATVEAKPGSWWYDTGTSKLYIRPQGTDITNAATFTAQVLPHLEAVYVNSQNDGECRFNGVTVFCRNIVWYGLYPWLLQDGTARTTFWGENCRFMYGASGQTLSGFIAAGADTYLKDCWINDGSGDNFNYHLSGSFECRAVEYNCKSYNAGAIENYGSGGEIYNASSVHEGATVLRVGGDYAFSNGPNIIDAGTGKSWNVGVKAHDSLAIGSTAGNDFSTLETRTMYLDACESSYSVTAGVYANGTSGTAPPIYVSGGLHANMVAATGNLIDTTTYNPLSPP